MITVAVGPPKGSVVRDPSRVRLGGTGHSFCLASCPDIVNQCPQLVQYCRVSAGLCPRLVIRRLI